MKFKLGEKDYLEPHHLYGLIDRYYSENNGTQPEYIIVHPATWHKIVMLTNERADNFTYQVFEFNLNSEKAKYTLYGIAFIRSEDVEPDFVIVT